MKDFQQKGRESAGIIINDNVDQSVSLMEYEVTDQFINHLINLNLPPFVVSQICQLYDEMNQEKLQKNPPLNQISQKILTYNRKEKSLSQLTKKFIQKFEGAKSNQLVIDKVTLQMNVQRRRIYDIINIMQSLNVVKKIRKNIYEWRGLIQALKTIESYDGLQDQQQMYLQAKSKKERSLQSLSTQFLRLFSKRKYNSKNKKDILTLQQASLIMMSDQQKDSKKTKVRRLYDIVNVFKCMGLVRKIKVEGCKPGYQWLGTRTLIKIIENKNLNTFSEVASQQEPDQYLSQIHNNQEQKNLKGQNQIQSIQIFQQDLKQNQKKYSRKKQKKYKSNRSNPNKIDSQKQEQVCDIKQIRLKKSQSCSTYMKINQNQLIQNQSIKSRQSRFSLHQSCRQKNSCSPITTITKISNSMSNRSIKKINFYSQKTKKQRALSNLQSNNLEVEQFCKEERQVQQKKQEIYSEQIQLPQLERRKGKVPKKFQKKSIQLEASQSLLSSLLRGYRKIGLITLDQLVSKLKQNLYNVNSFKSTIFNQNGLKENGISQEQRGFTKLFQRGRQLKNQQKQEKWVSLLSNQKASIDQKFNEINIY